MATEEKGPRPPRGDDPDEQDEPATGGGWDDPDPAPSPDEDSAGDWDDERHAPLESWGDSDP